MKMMKRVLAFALMLCILGSFLVIPDVAQAANYKGKTQSFVIRKSKADYLDEDEWYSSTGVKVKMKATSKDGKKGTITFQGTVPVKDLWGRDAYAIYKGVEYTYTISSLKNGGKITLKYSGGQYVHEHVKEMTGKIHIDKNKGCSIANIWKIDNLKFTDKSYPYPKTSWYFRND